MRQFSLILAIALLGQEARQCLGDRGPSRVEM